jgi:hypothetical protein
LNEKVTSGTPTTAGLLAITTVPLGPVDCRKAASTQPRFKPNWTSHQLKPCSQPNTCTPAPGGKIITEGKKMSGPARRCTPAVTMAAIWAMAAGPQPINTSAAALRRTIRVGCFVFM